MAANRQLRGTGCRVDKAGTLVSKFFELYPTPTMLFLRILPGDYPLSNEAVRPLSQTFSSDESPR